MTSFEAMLGSSLTLTSEWIQGLERNMPENRSRAAGGMTEDGKFFVLTGGLDRYRNTVSSVWVFDMRRGNWRTNFPRMNTGRYSHGCIIVGSKVYVFGGRNSLDKPVQSVEVLDLNQPQNSWTVLQPMRVARAPVAVERLGMKVYVFGSLSPPSLSNPNGSELDNSVECFDLQTHRWETRWISKIPNRGICVGSTVIQNKICLVRSGDTPMVFDGSAWKHHSAVPNLKLDQRRDRNGDILGLVHYNNKTEDEDEEDDEEEDPDENEQQQRDTNASENNLTPSGSADVAVKGKAMLIGVVLVAAAVLGGGAIFFVNNSSTGDDDNSNSPLIGQINVRLGNDEVENYFCLELSPRPTSSINVTCFSNSDDFPCCQGSNTWSFDPTIELSCGNLTGDKITSSVVVTCAANGYSNGTLVIDTPRSSPAAPPSTTPTIVTTIPTTPSLAPTETAAPSLSPTETTEGTSGSINVYRYVAEGQMLDLFCFDLIPKPSNDVIVTCVSSSEDWECCEINEGEIINNSWSFGPETTPRCGKLIETPSEETENSALTIVTCQANGYSDGIMKYLFPTSAPIIEFPTIAPVIQG